MLINLTKEEIELLKNAIYVAQQECQLPEPGDDGYEDVKAILDKFEDAQLGTKLRLMTFAEVKELANARTETKVLLEDRFGLKVDILRCIGYDQGCLPFVIFSSGDTKTLNHYGNDWRCWCVDKND